MLGSAGAVHEANGKAADGVRSFDLLDALKQEWLKLPIAAMRDVGPAAQTLGGIFKLTNRETFCATKEIAARARVPLATARKHLTTLHTRGWIENRGRGRTRTGAPRRTCTIRVTSEGQRAAQEYGILPWWATGNSRSRYHLTWSDRAVLSIVMARLAGMMATINRDEAPGDWDDPWDYIEELGGDDRFRLSLATLERQTGIRRAALVSAKLHLNKLGLIVLAEHRRGDGSFDADTLAPNPDFRVVIRPAEPGRCTIAFK